MKTIMIIDDSEADQFLSKCIIEQQNPEVNVLQAYDGLEALDILQKQEVEPDIIFIDLNMPRMNGYDFLSKYDCGNQKKSKIFILSSSDQEIDKERISEFSCVHNFIVKPFKPELLASF